MSYTTRQTTESTRQTTEPTRQTTKPIPRQLIEPILHQPTEQPTELILHQPAQLILHRPAQLIQHQPAQLILRQPTQPAPIQTKPQIALQRVVQTAQLRRLQRALRRTPGPLVRAIEEASREEAKSDRAEMAGGIFIRRLGVSGKYMGIMQVLVGVLGTAIGCTKKGFLGIRGFGRDPLICATHPFYILAE